MPTPQERSNLILRTLGGAGLFPANDEGPLLGPGKPLALLVHLALTPGRRTSRAFLMDLLWADLDPERARSALRQVLFHLRRLLGEGALVGSEELSLTVQFDIDRDRFLAAVERGDLESAIEMYQGPFLPSFGVPGGAAFERWADLERLRLSAAFLRSAELVTRRWLNQLRYREAQRLARRVRDELPDSETAWRLLLETIVAGQDFVAAAVEAEALERWAESEAIVLEPSTQAAIAQARRIVPAASGGEGDRSLIVELTGREREFSVITAAWERARSGPARHLHLTAAAGLGKSRLLRESVSRLRTRTVPVVEVHAAPGDRDIPFAFAGDLALALASLPGALGVAPASAAALIALNPVLSAQLAGSADPATGDEAVRRRIQALADLVHSVAHEQPFVLAIDDLHWVDAASFRVLEGVWARLNGARVLCLSAGRPERVPSDPLVEVLPIPPLSIADVGSMTAALGAVPDGVPWGRDFIAGLHRASRGSPFLILETLRLALDDGTLVLADGLWHCPDGSRLASLLMAGEALRTRIRGLSEREAWLLALLATAGTPIPPEDLTVMERGTSAGTGEALIALERQGFARRTAAGWVPSHDEIAAAARDALDPARQAEASRILGEFLIETRGQDSHRLLRGLRHLAAAGAPDLVRRHFRTWARLSLEHHGRRSFRDLAAEAIGESAESPAVTALVRSLPARWHLGLWTPARDRVAAVGFVMLAFAGMAFMSFEARANRTEPRLVYADSTGSIRDVSVRAGDFDGRNTLLVPGKGISGLAAAAAAYREVAPALSPDGNAVAWNQDSGDSTTLDIWIRTPRGTRRLTNHVRDDLIYSWAPDGSALIGLSNRWNPPGVGSYDVARFDTATGAAIQVTKGPAHDGSPFESPDGTRIAFIRETYDDPPRVCVIAFDGSSAADCRSPGGFEPAELLGWISPSEIAAIVDSAGARLLARYDWDHGELATLSRPNAYWGRLSPDRHWVVAALRLEGIRGFRDWIIPVDRPGQARQVDVPGGSTTLRWWEGQQDHSQMIDRIELADTSRLLLLGVTTRPGIRAFTVAGQETQIRAPVRWTTSDSTIAVVDSAGEIHPRRRGTVSIEASLAGWRTTRGLFRVEGDSAVTVFAEPWDARWQTRWITFGDPQPVVVSGPAGIPAFWNHGDGTYQSMGVTRQGFSAGGGLGVEVQLSTPVVRGDWQRARTVLVSGIDTTAYRHADQGRSMPSGGRSDAACGATFPPGTGRAWYDKLAVLGGLARVLPLGPTASRLGSGAWWTLQLQIMPDGRCAIAIDHRPIWISSEPIPLDGEFHLRLGDESAGTQLLHGPLRIWTGVRTDIDWSGSH